MSNTSKERSPWVYVGCGCALLAGLSILAMVILGAVGFRSAKTWMEDLKDPLLRNQEAREILGATTLPESYNAVIFMEVPWILKLVILSDGPVPDDPDDFEELGENSFIYINVRDFGNDREELRDFLTGKSKKNRALENMNIDIDFNPENILSRGTMDIGEQKVTYAVSQGQFAAQGDRGEGIFAMLMSDCPGDERLRMAYWLRRIEEPAAPGAEQVESSPEPAAGALEAETGGPEGELAPGLEGTPADPAALRRFLSNFDLCAG